MDNIIEVNNLVKRYRETEAVRDISFGVERGSFFAFLGINGAGKSTTINILCTVLEKTSGSVKIDGYDLDRQQNKIKELIGIVFQGSVLDRQLTVKENLISRASYYGLSGNDKKSIISSISRDFELDDIMNRRYERLSGGQRRRVDIARALINKPRILFLDEPTTGLDPMTRVRVWEIIHRLRRENGLTVFLTTHYIEETANCDKIVIIDSGKIAAQGSPNELKQKYASNSLLWYTQKSEKTEALLQSQGLRFEYKVGCYNISADDPKTAAGLIEKYSIQDFEYIKGNMDGVFLNVTGKRLGD